ncbi:hypothetical protein DLK05_03695 [Ancylomarina longa]|uniref:Uncharacterized protein n=1 Tax=Ancylomarina longa TaxID=2487017 RepID=A0A434AXQ8_9BACT|nr:hypothetical protein DLK05_03695 [Ancylomarina longa]
MLNCPKIGLYKNILERLFYYKSRNTIIVIRNDSKLLIYEIDYFIQLSLNINLLNKEREEDNSIT